MNVYDASMTAANSGALRAIRYPYLDFSRIIAASLVYAFHAEITGFSWGYVGVDFFIVLSGFVVTVAVLNTGGRTMGAFLKARLSRLVPGLLLFLVVATVVLLLLAAAGVRLSVLGYIFPSGLYYSNWYSIFVADDYFNQNNLNIFIHVWSLAVEEQFYAFFALLLLLPLRVHARVKAAALLVLVVTLLFVHPSMTNDRFYFGTESRAVQFLIGTLLAHYRGPVYDYVKRWRFAPMVGAFVLLAGGAIYFSADYARYFFVGYVAATATSAWFIVMSIRGSDAASPARPIVRKLGHASYLQYLVHLPLIFALTQLTSFGPTWKWIGLGILLVGSLGMSLLIEVPVQRFLRRSRQGLVLVGLPLILLGMTALSYSLVRDSLPTPVENTDLTTGYFFCDDLTIACLRAGQAESPAVLLIADSVGSALFDGALHEYATTEDRVAYVSAALPNCAIRSRLTVNSKGEEHFKYQNCLDNLPGVIDDAFSNYDIRAVVVSSDTDGWPFIGSDGEMLLTKDADWQSEAIAGALDVLERVDQSGVPVIFSIPPQPVASIDCLSGDETCEVDRRASSAVYDLYRALVDLTGNSTLVDINDVLCDEDVCNLVVEGKISRYDRAHFTRDASVELSDEIVELLGLEALMGG